MGQSTSDYDVKCRENASSIRVLLLRDPFVVRPSCSHVVRMVATRVFAGGRGRGGHTANDPSGAKAKGAKPEAERLVEGDVGREGRRRGEGDETGVRAREEEEEHQLRAIRCLEEGE